MRISWKLFGMSILLLGQISLSHARSGLPPEAGREDAIFRKADAERGVRPEAGYAHRARPGMDSSGGLTASINSSMKSPSADQIIDGIRRIEFEEIRYDEESPDYYGFIKGRIPVLISAPHGAKHFRQKWNRWKGEDEYTASLAVELGRLTGAYVIYVKNKTPEDPNNDPNSRYKKAVGEAVKKYHIRFLLDLHGSDIDRPYKVDVGIIKPSGGACSCPTFKNAIRQAFSGFEADVFNKTFCANDPNTLTFYARHQLGIEAAQVEVNAKYRIVERKPDSCKARSGIDPYFRANRKDVLHLVARLERVVRAVNDQIERAHGEERLDPAS